MSDRTNYIRLNPFPRDIELTEEEDHALKLLNKGQAEAEHQMMAFDVILKKICRVGANPHAADSHDTAFNAGLQAAGHTLIQIVSTPFKEKEEA